jgi:hypothetical protein
MRLFSRSATLLALVVTTALAFAGSSSAATVVVSPAGGVNGTATSAWELTIGTGSSAVTFNCANAGFSATLASASGPTFPLAISTNYQQNFSSCRTGSLSYNFACAPTAVLSVLSPSVAGVTSARLTALNCVASIGGSCSARITGSLPVTLTTTGAVSQLAVPTSGQAITVSGSTCTGTIPNGSAVFAAAGGGTFVYNIAPRTIITATP